MEAGLQLLGPLLDASGNPPVLVERKGQGKSHSAGPRGTTNIKNKRVRTSRKVFLKVGSECEEGQRETQETG